MPACSKDNFYALRVIKPDIKIWREAIKPYIQNDELKEAYTKILDKLNALGMSENKLQCINLEPTQSIKDRNGYLDISSMDIPNSKYALYSLMHNRIECIIGINDLASEDELQSATGYIARYYNAINPPQSQVIQPYSGWAVMHY